MSNGETAPGTPSSTPGGGGGTPMSVSAGVSVNAEYSRKYGFDASGATRVTARIVAMAPPVPLLMKMGVPPELITEVLKRTPTEFGDIPTAEMMKSTVSETPQRDLAESRRTNLAAAQQSLQARPMPAQSAPTWDPPQSAPTADAAKQDGWQTSPADTTDDQATAPKKKTARRSKKATPKKTPVKNSGSGNTPAKNSPAKKSTGSSNQPQKRAASKKS